MLAKKAVNLKLRVRIFAQLILCLSMLGTRSLTNRFKADFLATILATLNLSLQIRLIRLPTMPMPPAIKLFEIKVSLS